MSPTAFEHFNTMLGFENAGEVFSEYNEIGNEKLAELRTMVTSPLEMKEPRVYGITEAARMVGRSEQWLRVNVEDVPRSSNGHRIYPLKLIHALREQLGTNFQKPAGAKAHVLAVTNFKGGVGKTTTVVHAAHHFATNKAMKVLVIDLDPQASSTFSLGPFIPDLELSVEDTIHATLVSDPDHIAIRETYIPGLDIIPANLSIQDLDLLLPNPEINNSATMGPPLRRLHYLTERLRDYYDLILIDAPPNMGALTANALVACNALLIPVPPASYDLASFVMFSQAISDVYSRIGKQLDYGRMLITRHPGTATARKVESEIRGLYGDFVMSNHIVQTTEVEKACEQMTSVYDLNKPLTNRDTYQRALNSFNAVFDEMFDDFKRIWGIEGD